MKGALLAWLGYLGACALWAVSSGRVRRRSVQRCLAAVMAASMSVTLGLTIYDGKDLIRTVLPLHLCSISAFLTYPALLGRGDACFQFLWYIGLPGGLMALLFPAVESSGLQLLMNTAFFVTHGVIVLAPLLRMADGEMPRPEAAGGVMMAGGLMMAAVYVVDRLLNANYMFLLWAPQGTPLVYFERLGRPAYIALILGCAALVVLVMRLAARKAADWRSTASGRPVRGRRLRPLRPG